MKKIMIILFSFCSFTLFSQEKVNNASLLLKPLTIGTSMVNDGFVFAFEGQTAISEQWTLSSTIELGELPGFTVFSFLFGAQFHPRGEYLKGFYVGAYPGYTFGLDKEHDSYWDDESYFAFAVLVDCGYEWIIRDKAALTLSGGFYYFPGATTTIVPSVSLGMGFVFPDPFVVKYGN